MSDWIDALGRLAAEEASAVLVTVGQVRGSAPRETGARMVVSRSSTSGSIGGGQLEHRCTQIAAGMLAGGGSHAAIQSRRFPLGADCGQCCGGVVDVVFEFLAGSTAPWLVAATRFRDERVPAVIGTSLAGNRETCVITSAGEAGDVFGDTSRIIRDMLAGRSQAFADGERLLTPLSGNVIDLAVFGAGHVGSAVVGLLSGLDCRVRWVDPRPRVFPERLPANVTAIEATNPAREVAAMAPGAYHLVMTHSHPLDLDILYEVLKREDAAYCGLIGSRSKRRRFEKRLVRLGLPERLLAGFICPVGVEGVDGKTPGEIAIAVTAEILQTRDALRQKAGAPRAVGVPG